MPLPKQLGNRRLADHAGSPCDQDFQRGTPVFDFHPNIETATAEVRRWRTSRSRRACPATRRLVYELPVIPQTPSLERWPPTARRPLRRP